MNRAALRILKKVGKHGETSLAEAIQMAKRHHATHVDQYPLVLLLEGGYLGMTFSHSPPSGAEDMREFSLAITLHMLTLPTDENGIVHYRGLTSAGGLNSEKEAVFLKAKGALYLDNHAEKFRERLWSLGLGFVGGVFAAVVAAWMKGQLRLS